jgi:hypothetical protein
MSRYSKALVEKARIAYRETGNLTRTAEIVGVSKSTIHNWVRSKGWEKKQKEEMIEASNKDIDKVVTTYNNQLAKISEEAGLTEEDKEVLSQIRSVEQVIFDSIHESPRKLVKKYKLFPRTFDSAMKGFEKCWAARNALFRKNGEIGGSGEIKVNLVKEVNQFFNSRNSCNEAFEETTGQMVLEQPGNYQCPED